MKIKLLDKQCKPMRAHKTDSGLDLRARIPENTWLWPGEVKVIPTGIFIELPPGHEAQVRGRSGWTQRGVIVPTGTIDNSYSGEIKVTVINVTERKIELSPYDRIAQLVVCPVLVPEVAYVEELDIKLDIKDRGKNGHGSTGVT